MTDLMEYYQYFLLEVYFPQHALFKTTRRRQQQMI